MTSAAELSTAAPPRAGTSGAGTPRAGTSGAGTSGAGTSGAEDFLAHRPMLFGLAYRILGSRHDAEDVLQDAYLRWSRADRGGVDEPRRYLTTVVTRLAVDHLRARQSRRETYVGQWLPEPVATGPSPFGAVDTSELSIAVLYLMERLTAPQRAVYVLRTAFELPYDEIATIVERTPEDCRQLHRRAARALQDGRPRFAPSRTEYERLLTEFLAAARGGDLARLDGLLHADVVAYSDGGGRVRAALNPIVSREKVTRFLAGIRAKVGASTLERIELNGLPAAILTGVDGRYVVTIEVRDNVIIGIYLIANPDKLPVLGEPVPPGV